MQGAAQPGRDAAPLVIAARLAFLEVRSTTT